jgi:protein gp37
MSGNSKIEWTDTTWNPVTGCTKLSDGCKNCYAARMAIRLKAMGNDRYKNGFMVTLQHDLITTPLSWRKPKRIFVNSMSDLFHEEVPLSFIKEVFSTMEKASWHTFQIVTKRSERLLNVADNLKWPSNVWMGVTVESHKYKYRINDLCKTPAHIKFVSIEPLLALLTQLPFSGIDWIIVGGESGYGARPMKKEWVLKIMRQCLSNNIPFFFKQWGGVNKKKHGRLLDGKEWNQIPDLSNSTPLVPAV